MNLTIFTSVFLSQGVPTVDPRLRNLTVSTELHCRFLFTNMDGCLGALCVPSSCSLYCRMVHTRQRKSDESFSCLQVSGILLHFVPRHTPRLCQLHLCFHLVWLYGSFFSTACVDCHLFVLLHRKTCFKLLSPRSAFHHTHPTAFHILSAITSDKKGIHLDSYFLATLQIRVSQSRPRFIFLFLKKNEETTHRLCFPSSDSVQRCMTPRTLRSTAHACFCGSSHLSTKPCLHSCILPHQGVLCNSPDGSW